MKEQYRSYMSDEIETRNREDILFSSRVVLKGILVPMLYRRRREDGLVGPDRLPWGHCKALDTPNLPESHLSVTSLDVETMQTL